MPVLPLVGSRIVQPGRSFRIVDGEITEEDVDVVESFLFGHTPTTVVYD